MAMHSGVTHERDGDYFGPGREPRYRAAVSDGARRAKSSYPEQPALLLRDLMPERAQLYDLGEAPACGCSPSRSTFGNLSLRV